MISAYCAFLLFLGSSAPPRQEQGNATPLHSLEFMIGTWVGEKNEDGSTEEHIIKWIHDRHYIKSEYTLKTKDGQLKGAATSILCYDTVEKEIRGFIFAKDGIIARARVVSTNNKDTWVFEGVVSVDGETLKDRATHTKLDNDTFRSKVEIMQDGEFKVVGTYTYRRKK